MRKHYLLKILLHFVCSCKSEDYLFLIQSSPYRLESFKLSPVHLVISLFVGNYNNYWATDIRTEGQYRDKFLILPIFTVTVPVI